ncbi:dihydroxyacetone kinase subunit DhaK [Agrilactobacillus yilanensis]|uniref:Dihydroxyacetone kinase subunit DhaK n=1 Tax=Agrilactobacillus yilanensis TaxID=2485997 RepID=A0ABW4J5S8_9LACO|nr:dihydroxyacetone kinase subunit DhaK [Agrilactobacillus yilanensis]
MKKLINQPQTVVQEMLAGILKAYPQLVKVPHVNAVVYPHLNRQTRLISGGGSGHEPLDVGYLGPNLLDAAILGAPFTPPTPEAIVATVEFFKIQKPVVFIIKNFIADLHNFKQAQKQLIAKGYQVGLVIVDDDRSVNPDTLNLRRRGVAGTVFVHKILGYAAEKKATLETLVSLGKAVNANLCTLSAAFTGSELPDQQAPSFELASNEVAYGVGIHGEAGYRKEVFHSADLLARELVNKLLQTAPLIANDHCAVLVNGLGALPLMDQFIFAHDICELLTLKQIQPQLLKVGNFLTAYNMSGVSVTLLKLVDPDWLTALNAEVTGFAWH